MKEKRLLPLVLVGLACLCVLTAGLRAQAPRVNIPNPGVPQITTLEGNFTRVAYNNEGYTIIGYQLAQRSVGEEWMLLEVGLSLRDKTPDFKLTRGAFSLETPDGKTIPLATITEHRQADTRALENRSKVQRDSINYFPPNASRACRLGFFADPTQRIVAYDEVTLTDQSACVGRLYFHVPGGIMLGQHWLNVKFANSTLRVPFRIFTADEEKLVSKNFKDIKKQVEEAFKPAKK
jgi:hypothetical protein